jgi:hypothetical protein
MSGQQLKLMTYDYDLISGNVNEVKYQPGKLDQFYHHYYYDADNRLQEVSTSRDNVIWERDAMSFYYRHGPLYRTEVGDLLVQGIDNVYTINGWLKGVNAGALSSLKDMGRDGKQGSNPHQYVATDAYGFLLDYHENDYAPINPSVGTFIPLQGDYNEATPDLFNGNIRAMSTALMNTTYSSSYIHDRLPVLGMAFNYDQMNRLTASHSYEKTNMQLSGNFTWDVLTETPKWKTSYTYDANGNIKKLNRGGNNAVNLNNYDMDKLNYVYSSGTNKLTRVTDGITIPGAYAGDIESGQVNNNYTYDAIGNLTQDLSEGISSITWYINGKLKKVTKTGGYSILFDYDAAGNRIMKKVTSTANDDVTTFYIRDAQGNIMATYEKREQQPTMLYLAEQHIYGSSRLGYVIPNISMNIAMNSGPYFNRVLGEKQYELSNHLGNVLAVITDRKFGINTTIQAPDNYEYFEPDVQSYTDYYPFGAIMPGRSYSSSDYSFGFNGQMKTDEISGAGNHNTAEYWEYDTRLGRRWNVEPLIGKYPFLSPYCAFSNNPILFNDPDGAEIVIGGDKQFRRETRKNLQMLTNDKVSIDRTGHVVLKERNQGKKELGTSVIRQLVTSTNSHAILKTINANEIAPISPGGMDNPNVYNGKGASSVVFINAERKESPAIEGDGFAEATNQILLGHELLHASDIDNGTVLTGTADPNGASYSLDLGGSGKPLLNEEIKVRSLENILRKEQGIKEMRAAPVYKGYIELPEINVTPQKDKK